MRHWILLTAVLAMAFAATPSFAAKCPANATKASASLWPSGSIPAGQTVTKKHPCGRSIECTGGTDVATPSRHCRWL